MSFYFEVGIYFLMCVIASVFWGIVTNDWWGRRWGITLGLFVFGIMFYSIFSDYAGFLESTEYAD